ncbi:serine/threonine-protein kinase [Derxia lacustris]|uniref:serine/threonine-protein kinase n=1 Tax=Derxia lacustris TaxID=764842 RepID=UPI000A171178|nr:serine/threonine-protein kinase [Derxia lacustris]
MNAATGAIPLPGVPTIGRFRIERTLGVGSMGTVYLAHDSVLHRSVAIKTLSVHLAPSEARAFEDSFLNEARAVARLNHPNIVTVYDAGRVGGVPYIAMECLDGQELKQRLARAGRMPMREFVELFVRVADALDYAHRHGIVHRDIKPANIFLTAKSGPKVLDFGIAQAATLGQPPAARQQGTLVGTPNYMSPELIQGQPLDGRSDLFSLGVVMYEVLTGKLPFSGRTLDELTQNIVNAPVTPPQTLNPDVPIEISAIVARALAKLPEQRYADARALADDLRRQLERMDVQRLVTRAGMALPAAVAAAPRRSRGLLALLLTGLVAGGVFWQLGRQEAPAARPATAVARAVTPAPTVVAPAATPAADPAAAGTPATDAAPADPAPTEPQAATPEAPAGEPAMPATASGRPATGALQPPRARSPAPLMPDPAPPAGSTLVGPPAVGAPSSAPAPAAPAGTGNAARNARLAPQAARPAASPASPAAPAVVAGTLDLAVSPWGEVIINGQSRGLTPPLSSIKLAPGSYSIEIRNGDFPTYFTTADIQSNGSTRIRHKF